MKRKLKWLAAVLAVLLLGFSVVLFLWPRDRITGESYEMIRIGMTMEEVEALLGRSGISHAEYRAQNLEGNLKRNGERLIGAPEGEWEPEGLKIWVGQNGAMGIQFRDGQVVRKLFQGMIPLAKPNIIDRFAIGLAGDTSHRRIHSEGVRIVQ